MSPREEDVEARLARLSRETEALGPSPGFNARVMAAIDREEPAGFVDALWASSRRLLPIAALAAAVAVVWAVQSHGTADDALAITYGSVDLDGE
jgi:hypothetical protein